MEHSEMVSEFWGSFLTPQPRDLSWDDWIKEFMKLKWSSGLFWAVGSAEKKNLPYVCNFLGWFFQLFKVKKSFRFFFFKNFRFFLPTKSWKNHPQKLHMYGSLEFFLSASLTAQNSPELHFCFINSFIQTSLC